MEKSDTVPGLLDEFLHKYELQLVAAKSDQLKDSLPAIRSAVLHKCLQIEPFSRRRFADKRYNARFLRVILMRKLLATMLGVTEKDLEIKIRHSGRTAPRYLEIHLEKLLPKTFLGPLK
ncbi:hypothetical protein HQ520_15085 [bacterium]|nr:hypothetical protein [bacterium]